jgi:hypothetical protein
MVRSVLVFLTVLSAFTAVLAQTTALDSLPQPAVVDTIYLIPAGPVAGTFTPAARVTVSDTVAGWARILVEGWVPAGAVLDRMKPASSSDDPVLKPDKSATDKPRQCAATTTKGTRCKRNASPGSIYCWQHQK